MRGFVTDCRHAVRLYLRTPRASLVAVLVLGVGMSFVGTFLSLYVDLVLRPHPGFVQSGRIGTVGVNLGSDYAVIRYDLIERMSEEVTSVEAVAAWTVTPTVVGVEREATTAGLVSAGFFPGLRPRLALGRGLRATDHAPDAEPVVVLSHRLWRERFDADPAVLGTVLEIARDPASALPYSGPPGSSLLERLQGRFEPEQDSAQFRIVGVTSATLPGLPLAGGTFELPFWLPLERVWPLFRGVSESLPEALVNAAYVRRGAGAAPTAVENELRTRYVGPDSTLIRPGATFDVVDGIVSDFVAHADAKRQLELFLAGSLLLALVAAANVSLFLLVRAPGRRRELGIRLAVGAPTRRLARQLGVEAGLLVAAAGVLGLIGSIWLNLYIRSLSLLREAQWQDVTLLDWRVLSLAAAVLVVLTLLVALAPILGLKRAGIGASSRQATAGAAPAQRLAGAAQIAVAGMLGGAAIAFGWHIGQLMFADPGYEMTDRYVVQFTQLVTSQPTNEGEDSAIVTRARRYELIEAIPGVNAITFGVPMPGYQIGTPQAAQLTDPNNSANSIGLYTGNLDHAFVDVLGLRLVHGRAPDFAESDVLLVNQTLARALFGRENVVGERFPVHGRRILDGLEIIGVLEDLAYEHPAAAVRPYVFTTGFTPSAVVESQLTAAGLRQAFDRAIADGALEARISVLEPLGSFRDELIAPDRARGFLTMTTAVLAVLMAAFGYYGTQRYLVAAGRREYAIRASLGASPRAIGRLVLRRGLLMSLPGLALGALLAFIVVGSLRGDYVVRNVSPALVTLWVIVGLTLILLAAGLGPAREARRTQPAPLLRED